jgi:hypothetical protein
MSSEEFCMWLAGFIEASNHYNLTPAGWQAVKDRLKEVKYGQNEHRITNLPWGNGTGNNMMVPAIDTWTSTNTQNVSEPKKQMLND